MEQRKIPGSKVLRALLSAGKVGLLDFKKNANLSENYSLNLERKDRERAFMKGFY